MSKSRKKTKCFKKTCVLALGLFFLLLINGYHPAWSAETEYPYKPIKIIIPFEPGAIIDVAVRVMTEYLTRELKVPMVIENRGGAGGILGANEVLRAKPDGYTLLACGDAALTIAPLTSPNPPFDPFRDFLPICGCGGAPSAFGVYKSSPMKTLADLVKEAKENPGKVTAAITTYGGETHLDFERFRKAAGVNMKLVPYKGTGEGVSALMGRHIDMLLLSYTAFLPYLKSGEVRLLAIGETVPGSSTQTFDQAGYPGTTFPRVNGFYVTAKTPLPIYENLCPYSGGL